MASTWTIYLMRDPIVPSVGYVGLTRCTLAKRQARHRSSCRHEHNKRAEWLRSLLDQRLWPDVSVLETCTTQDEANAAEQRWIDHARDVDGMTLMNSIAGGYFVYNEEHRARMISVAARRPESKARRSKASKRIATAKWRDPESRALRVAGMRRSWTEERKAAARARWNDPDFRARVIARQKEVFAAPEERARRSALATKRNAQPEVREANAARTRQLWKDEAHRRMRLAAQAAAFSKRREA